MENTFVLFDETKECVVIDPGCYEPEERHELQSYITDNKLKVTALLNTHCHIDHVLGNAFIKENYGVDLLIHPQDDATLKAVKIYAPNYGFPLYQEATADKFIDEGDIINFGNSSLEILFVPGHSPGHIAFYDLSAKICIGGDVLFRDSIGRTDLPGGNFNILISSIHNKLFKLEDDMTVYPGHGPETLLGYEKQNNPFCALK
ncbi:MAG: MBL fold metallo-hydrolase [Bacteroidota bacterium]|nr:MBL fold metallo-hydrolase [Bacteroidota bacterium]